MIVFLLKRLLLMLKRLKANCASLFNEMNNQIMKPYFVNTNGVTEITPQALKTLAFN